MELGGIALQYQENEPLAKHTTFKMGGTAIRYYIPENENELLDVITNNKNYLIISGGSNLLINDTKEFPCVIDMHKACTELKQIENGVFYIGASVRIQKAIRFINSCGYGGIEFLFSLPALVGGCIYMNAGRGADKSCIGDFFSMNVPYFIASKPKNSFMIYHTLHFNYLKCFLCLFKN